MNGQVIILLYLMWEDVEQYRPGAFQIYALKPARTGGTATEPLLQWWTAYPVAISSPASLSSGEVAEMIAKADPDFAIIDVRRTDFKASFMFTAYSVRC